MIRSFSIFCIRLYQKYLSPRKGYRCAHSVLHGDTGCSGAVIQIIQENSIMEWRKLIRTRFDNCRLAHEELKEKKKDKNGKCSRCKNKLKSGCGDGADCGLDFLDCDGCGDCGDIGSCN